MSTQERVNEILQTALARAESMEPVNESSGILRRSGSHVNYGSATVSPRTSPARQVQPQARQPAQQTDSDSDAMDSDKSHWKDYLAGFWSVELEAKGSVVRDHLALERTYLAWLRTSMAFGSIGIAVTQLFRLNTAFTDENGNNPNSDGFNALQRLGKPLGATFIAISILILFLGVRRFFEGQKWLIKGKFPAARGTVVLVTLIALALMVASLVVILVFEPTI